MAEKLGIEAHQLSFKIHPSIDGHGHAYFYEAPSSDGTGRVYSAPVYGIKVSTSSGDPKKEGYIRVLSKEALDFCVDNMVDHQQLRNEGIKLD